MQPSDWTEEQSQSLLEFLNRKDRAEGSIKFHELRGFLFAMVFSPEQTQVQEWVPEVFGGTSPDFLSKSEGQSVLKLLMRMWNNIATLTESDCTDVGWLLGGEPTDEIHSEWADGFLRGWERVSPHWNEALEGMDPEVAKLFDTSLLVLQFFSEEMQAECRAEGDPEALAKYAESCRKNFLDAVNVYKDVGTAIFRARLDSGTDGSRRGEGEANVPIRVEKGPGRNDPCSCGSGKKFKKCCLH